MSIKSQLTLDYKLAAPAFSRPQRIPTDANTTFDNIQTPGWSSMVRTQPNVQQTNRTATQNNQILQKLSKMDHINLSNSQFSKIRTNNNVNLLSHKNDCSTHSRSILNKENCSVHLRSFNDDQKQKKLQSTTIPSQSRIQLDHSIQKSSKSVKRGRTATIVKNKPREVEISQGNTQRERRFNHITVHQHLYLDSKRQETKRMMEKVMEQQYKKQNVLLFRPTISKKSAELAEVKFSRMQKLQQMESQIISELNQLSKRQNQKKAPKTNDAQKQRKQKSRYESANNMFYFLSNNTQSITKETLKEVIQELPLVCIKVLQKIIEKVYQGKEYSWLQFLSSINDKKLITNRQGLLIVFEKWYNRQKKKTNDQNRNLVHSTYCS